MVSLFLASFSTVSAKPGKSIECLMDIGCAFHDGFPDGTACWYGPLHDCTLESPNGGHIRSVAVRPSDRKTSGNTLHFFEEFTIYAPTGEIYGENAGIADQKKFKYRANGWVTGATEEWEHLVGSKLFEMGTVVPGEPPLMFEAPDTPLRIVPAQRSMP
jgi:hypothetical protein